MATTQDVQLGLAVESTYKTGVTPTQFYEIVDENLDWNNNVVQGQGLRVGSRVARSGRRTVPTADGGGDFTVEWANKGMGKLLQACLGSGTATLVAGSTYQHNFTLADNPSSLTIQKGSPEVNGVTGAVTVDPVTYLGCMVSSFTISFDNAGLLSLQTTVDAGDFTTATALASASYSTGLSVFDFHTFTAATGTLTSPTTTNLASGTTVVGDIRSGSITVNKNIRNDRFNIGGSGRKAKPSMGLIDITGTIDVEYDATTFRDAYLNQTNQTLLLQATGGALSTGVETVQIVLPVVGFDTGTPNSNGNDLIVVTYNFTVLDNLTTAQPIWIVQRTSDSTI